MQDPRVSAALSVMMGIDLTGDDQQLGDDEKMETESPLSPPKSKKEPTPPPEKMDCDNNTEEQKQVFLLQDILKLQISNNYLSFK